MLDITLCYVISAWIPCNATQIDWQSAITKARTGKVCSSTSRSPSKWLEKGSTIFIYVSAVAVTLFESCSCNACLSQRAERPRSPGRHTHAHTHARSFAAKRMQGHARPETHPWAFCCTWPSGVQTCAKLFCLTNKIAVTLFCLAPHARSARRADQTQNIFNDPPGEVKNRCHVIEVQCQCSH